LTGCGCALLIALLVGGIVFMIFGSTDTGEPVAQIAALAVVAGVAAQLRTHRRMTLVPRRLALVRTRRAQ
jgi:hypothetical protein